MHFHKDHGLLHGTASEITPRAVYEQRRSLIKAMAAGAAGLGLAAWAARDALGQVAQPGKLAALHDSRPLRSQEKRRQNQTQSQFQQPHLTQRLNLNPQQSFRPLQN